MWDRRDRSNRKVNVPEKSKQKESVTTWIKVIDEDFTKRFEVMSESEIAARDKWEIFMGWVKGTHGKLKTDLQFVKTNSRKVSEMRRKATRGITRPAGTSIEKPMKIEHLKAGMELYKLQKPFDMACDKITAN